MFKLTGWDQGSFFMSAAALGGSYMEFFVTFIYKAYNWLFNIFDNKIVPNLPSNPNSQFNGWNIRPMKENDYISLAESAKSWYRPSHPTSVSSWSDWLPSFTEAKTWLYIGVGIITIAAIYSGYLYFTNWQAGDVTPTAANFQQPPVYPEFNVNGYLRKAADVLIFNRINNLYDAGAYVSNKILPSMAADQFEDVQRNAPISQKYMQYYPFTQYDPTAPWSDRIKMSLFTESEEAKIKRELYKDLYTAKEMPGCQPPYARDLGAFVEGNSKGKEVEWGPFTPSPLNSPMLNGYGILIDTYPIEINNKPEGIINFNEERIIT